ncbi:pyrroloquinoline quinone biosynthesis peptide chaperone PqqD [Streptomyces clavuligerus]|uniref:Coenzyme PQQ synthesis D n=1 Tax=Streptomyces clavuligerus TaxID=1901 RepID=E2PY03_STRCL|nr:pyrroloquinoline quinone biosynthesis peptide chaperone PqqD [Streptomyces clavuligerus]ANW17343.1 pyrroloquinoline quinone biosynthesis protein PqqD [Streptomyces clavuligerus]AXU11894.1 pyrroloquinoline quinone biosynthesis peptide chaperone PqqD [Streptomyces clavuligerus]EFG10179.1 coenzyme PQQ synthesis D [Streptomyces clavuligerus]MBY6301734.1 pyrroloquinoline quinone biosynthesis peptide chaperone PqqD [Streptomyces clavuligerus]QCS04673.1 pyrroloquinoline quinone biosynthesis peptid
MTGRPAARPAHPAPGPDPSGEPWRPALARSVVLRHDRVRGTDLLLLPERAVVLKGAAGPILRLCDGTRDLAALVAELGARHPGAPVADEVPRFLARVREEGWIV